MISTLKTPRVSARALIIDNGRVLLFHRRRYDRKLGMWLEYYSIPGGGVDAGESIEAAAVRELKEEMGVDIRLKRKVAVGHFTGYEHHVFAADIISGQPRFMADSEEAAHSSEHNQYRVEWVDVATLSVERLMYYGGYLAVMRQLADGADIDSVMHLDDK